VKSNKLLSYIEDKIQQQWYSRPSWILLLYPICILFLIIIKIRKKVYSSIALKAKFDVWIIGDITVGGSGKSPFIEWLSNYLNKFKFDYVIIGHGYKNNLNYAAEVVTPNSDPNIFGDEAVMLAKSSPVPVVVGKNRQLAIKYITENFPNVKLAICDDGLQYYKMPRDKEIIILNERRLGNKYCLPVGPLREPLNRIKSVDLIVKNNNSKTSGMYLEPIGIRNIATNEFFNLDWLSGKTVHAVAAIGDPKQFFSTVKNLTKNVIVHKFRDHYNFDITDLMFDDDLPVIITQKDAVKCKLFNNNKVFVLETKLLVSDDIKDKITLFATTIS
jgi:tetraacyldisaccharide 4'-kinase